MTKKPTDAYGNILASLQRDYEGNVKLLDTQLLTLSAGTLGLSLTFIASLVVLASAILLPLLIFAWFLLVVSVVAILSGLRFATSWKTIKESKDYARQATGWGDYEELGPNPREAQIRMDRKSKRLEVHSQVSFWAFFLGLFALLVFISVNLLYAQDCHKGRASEWATKYVCPVEKS